MGHQPEGWFVHQDQFRGHRSVFHILQNTMVRVLCTLAGVVAASQDAPTRPHLAQAWSAQSIGDGMPGVAGQEYYLYGDEERHHLWDYGATGQKLWTCPHKNEASCIVYYLKLNGPNCCKCKDVNAPKQWDINQQDGLFTKTNFVAYEDTTELNDNPVTGAEHWAQSSILPKVLSISYDFFLHREENGDVISHRIDFNTSVQQQGSILYGNFQVAHDIDAHREHFALPDACTGNILNCCDDMDALDKKYDFHRYAVRQAEKASISV
jgi:hypothetical protein